MSIASGTCYLSRKGQVDSRDLLTVLVDVVIGQVCIPAPLVLSSDICQKGQHAGSGLCDTRKSTRSLNCFSVDGARVL